MRIYEDFSKKVKNRENGFYSSVKDAALFIYNFHIPLFWPVTLFYKALYLSHIFIRETVILILKILYFEPMFRSRCVRAGKNLRMSKLPYIVGDGLIEIGMNANLSGRISIGFNNRMGEPPRLVIGDNVFIGHLSSFGIARRIEIGKNCYISSSVRIFDNDGHPVKAAERKAGRPVSIEDVKPVKLCDNVWIGTDSIILKGVTIGENAVVGAGSVVVKDVPANSVVAGNPAGIIKVLNTDAK